MVHIIRTNQEYEGLSWFVYNEAYRRQAAATGHMEWSKINPSIFTVCFTSKARRGQRCEWCLSASHCSEECMLAKGEMDAQSQPRVMESTAGATQWLVEISPQGTSGLIFASCLMKADAAIGSASSVMPV